MLPPLFDLEDADLADKQKKQALNPHIELRECLRRLKISVFPVAHRLSGPWLRNAPVCVIF